MAAAQKAGDHRTVAQLLDAITRADAELARLYALGASNLNVNVKVDQTPGEIIDAARGQLLAVLSAETVTQKELT